MKVMEKIDEWAEASMFLLARLLHYPPGRLTVFSQFPERAQPKPMLRWYMLSVFPQETHEAISRYIDTIPNTCHFQSFSANFPNAFSARVCWLWHELTASPKGQTVIIRPFPHGDPPELRALYTGEVPL